MDILFKDNKYSKWYFNIIQNASDSTRSKKDRYYESHHIIPKSFDGNNTRANLVLLTPREHFLCHLLLPKMLCDPIKAGKMVYAFFRMKDKYKNSRMFDRFKTAYGKLITGENNKFFGKKHTPETLKKISRIGTKHTPESIERMSAVKIGKGCGEANPMFGKVHSEEWRINHSEKMSGQNHFNYGKPSFVKGRSWINNSIASKMVGPDDLPSFLNAGWIKGRLP